MKDSMSIEQPFAVLLWQLAIEKLSRLSLVPGKLQDPADGRGYHHTPPYGTTYAGAISSYYHFNNF